MLDYRNNIKRILQNTQADDQSLENSLNAIKAIIAMADNGKKSAKTNVNKISKPSNGNLANKNHFKNFFVAISKLIENPGDKQAKSSSLKALHKLSFIPGFGKDLGKEIGQLDQAIQASTETADSVNAKTFKEAVKVKKIKRDYREGKRYTVIRLLSGADLINQNDEVAFSVNEAQAHSLNLKSGDVVEALPAAESLDNQAEIIRVVGYKKLRQRDYDPIEDFKYAVVQGEQGRLAISRNINGQKLRIRGKNIVLPVDPSYYQGDSVHLEDGSIVDLAWYTGDIRLKKDPAKAIKIRWIYQVDQPKKNKRIKKDKKKQTQIEKIANLDLDLHYQRVGIAIGDNQNEQILEEIVARYNGIPLAIDAFEGKKKVIEKQIKDLDIVILVTAYAAHDSTWNIREFASKYNVNFAVSSSKGYQSFERALYRAVNGLPSYEGTQSIEYQTKEK